MPMLAFRPQGHARFSYRAVFAREDFCNLSFFDADQSEILYHLSLRASEGLAVVNRRGKRADAWGRERRHRLELSSDGVEVDIFFDRAGVRVHLNGSEVSRLGSSIVRRFPRLPDIAFADFQGGLLGPTLDMDVHLQDPLGLPDTLRLNQRLELRGALKAGERVHLDLPQMPLPPPLITTSKGATQHLRAVIPGRIWQAVPADADLDIAIMNGPGTALAALSISRAALAQRITDLLEGSPSLRGDVIASTQIIEHVRFAGLWPRLSIAAQGKLVVLARSMGLEAFLQAPAMTHTSPKPTKFENIEESYRAAVSDYVSGIVRKMRASPDQGVAALLLASPPPKNLLKDVCLNLTEAACRQNAPGGFDALFEAARELGLGKMPQMDNAWSQSAVLPWRVLEGAAARLPEPIQTLAWDRTSWLLTPPLAWTMIRLLDRPPEDATTLKWTVEAFLSFVLENSQTYWDRATCVELTRAAAALIKAADRFDAELSTLIKDRLLGIYGLTPAFWEAIGTEVPAFLKHHAEAWQAIASQQSDDPGARDARESALTLFADANCIDLPRFRRDLSGRGGHGSLDGADAPAGLDRGEAALRHLAHPLTPEEPSPDTPLALAAHDAMPRLYKETPLGPQGAAQTRASMAAAHLLAAARAAPDTACDDSIDALIPQLAVLTDDTRLGPAMGLGLLAGLIAANAHAPAATLWAKLKPLLEMPLPDTPPMARAQVRLAEHADHELAAAALDHFATPVKPPAVLSPAVAALHRAASPLHDTLVTVFSCAPHLETRIPQMRQTWLGDLAKLGVPYVIVVGGGSDRDGVLEGDVLTLDAPDDYEGLPQKTLATVKWVHGQTRFSHLYKVDDDCFVNAEAFFHGQSHGKFDYYGRPLIRVVGQMDRGWHVAKSTTPRGRLELDKSPEPSLYADGGSGYTLSRRAMGAALHALETAQGRSLVQTSFMEDKLLGDLLAVEGIHVSGEDYHITVRRREAPGGIAIPRWVNGFDASRTAPVKLVHLDDPDAQATAQARLHTPALRPAKIWPSYQEAALGPNTNALELISDPARLAAAETAPVSVVACMRNEMFMLPHFLAHYRKLGVESFLIADNCSDDGTLEFLADEPDVAVFSVDTEYSRSHYGVAWQQALLSAFRVNKWALVADADELLIWQHPQTQSLPELLQDPAFAKADAVRLFMLDMYPEGPLADADFSSGDPFAEAGFVEREPFLDTSAGRGPFSDAPTWTSALRHRLIPGSRPDLFVAQKLALLKYRPWMRASAGLHYVAGVTLAKPELFFAHFKYNADFRRKVQAEVARGQHFNDAEEYRKYLAVVSEGRDVIYDPGRSVPWTACDFVSQRLRRDG